MIMLARNGVHDAPEVDPQWAWDDRCAIPIDVWLALDILGLDISLAGASGSGGCTGWLLGLGFVGHCAAKGLLDHSFCSARITITSADEVRVAGWFVCI